ncbi:MAG: 3-methyl-2-oxobutanoate dehydrogenase subunit VorB [Clostridiales bacterium]|jgi:2-oxoglutarate ferredoxin oxidoreductase subunit alpha|nr:3-methyl-2-oxobutanoate dehydrogenase subunit VorB [Clostridiales bacterium]
MKGNEAIAEAAINAGCRFFFGYPITPQTEVAAYMAKKMPKIGGTYLQAESEIAAINMVIGASAAGARVLTSSSSPGISLKSEGLSYLAGCDLPAVIVNIQRGGPGLGGIQPSQADYFLATRSSGHGDFHMIVLAPNNIQEIVDVTQKAFDLADKYRMCVMILGDGILGQMMEPAIIDASGNTGAAQKPWALTGTGGKRKKNIVNSLYLQPEELEEKNFARYEKYKEIAENEAMCEEYKTDDADIILVSYGATSRICKNAITMARAEGIKAGLLRPITLWPFPKKSLMARADGAKAFISVEMSMGQMIEDVKLAIECKKPVALCSRTGGIVHSPEDILAKIKAVNGGDFS